MANRPTDPRSEGIISVTNQFLIFGGTLIPTQSISRLRTFQVSKKSERALSLAGLSVAALVCAGITLYYPVQGLENTLPGVLAVIGVGFALSAFKALMFRQYGLSIETNGGTRDFIASKNRRFAQQVLESLVAVIANRDTPRSMTINMNNNTIEGDTFNMEGNFGVGVQKNR